MRVVGEGELLGVAEPREDPLPRRRGAEQEQPPHTAAVRRPLGAGSGSTRRETEVALVDERGEPLRPSVPRRGPRMSRAPPRRPRREAGPLQRRPGAGHAGPDAPRGARSWSASQVLPSATTRPPRSSTRNVIRRWSGTRARSHSSGGTPKPVRASSTRASSSVKRPARRVGVRKSRRGVVGRRARSAAGSPWAGTCSSAVARSLAQPRHLPVEPVGGHLVEHGDRHVHRDPVGLGARLELVRHAAARGRPAARRAGSRRRDAGRRRPRSSRSSVNVSRSGCSRRSSFHQRSKCRADTTSAGAARRRTRTAPRRRRGCRADGRASSSSVDPLDQRAVVAEEPVVGLPVALDERVPDEQLAATASGSTRAYWTVRASDERHAVQRHPLVRHRRARSRLPVRLAVACA